MELNVLDGQDRRVMTALDSPRPTRLNAVEIPVSGVHSPSALKSAHRGDTAATGALLCCPHRMERIKNARALIFGGRD